MKGFFDRGGSSNVIFIEIGLLLICMKIRHISCEEYHIVSSPSDPCSVESCYTLLQFVSNEISLVKSNNTLLLLPGNHNLELVFMVSSVDYFAMVALSQQVSIVCDEDANFQFADVRQMVHIRGIDFIDCAGNKVDTVELLLIEDCTFTGEGSKGSALDFLDSSANIQRTSFIGCSAGVNSSCRFNTTLELAGGAIRSTHSSLAIDQCIFESNTAELGGAIFGEFYSNITIHNSLFVKNYATTFRPHVKSCGGAMYLDTQSYVEVHRTSFTNNRAGDPHMELGNGGVLGAESGSILNITHCNLTHNFAHNGVVVYARLATVRIVNSLLKENHFSPYAGLGGVLFAEEAMIHFELSTISDSDGAIHLKNVTMFARECKFLRNGHLQYAGGAIWASGTKLSSIQNHFIKNRATVYGGALYCYDCTVEMVANEFIRNCALYFGGGVYLIKGSIAVNGSYFDNNGRIGVYARVTEMNIMNSEFTNNYGGALRAYNSTSYLISCQFLGNTNFNTYFSGGAAISIVGNSYNPLPTSFFTITESEIFDSATAEDGGAISVSDAIVQIYRVSFGNISGGALLAQRSTVNMIGCTITNTKAMNGGAVSTSEVNLMATNVTIHYCSAQNKGAIIHSSKSNVSLSNVLARYNSAAMGGMYLSLSTMLLHDTQYQNNRGSLYILSSTVTFTGCTVFSNCSSETENFLVEVGGAITAFKSIIVLNGTTILSNNHGHKGGAIHATESEIRVNNEMTVSNNTAERSGGGIYLHWSKLNCFASSVCNIVGNSATLNGGGVQALGSTIAGYSDAVININKNQATRGGGISLVMNARITVTKTKRNFNEILFFESNVAVYGGAMYVSDETNSACDVDTECFYQVFAVHDVRSVNLNLLTTTFSDNYAHISGADLFGGLLDRCTVSPYAEVNLKYTHFDQRFLGVSYLLNTSNLDNIDTITSNPVRICFCKDGQTNCTFQPSVIQVKKGETFNVSLVAVDQVDHPVNATIVSTLDSTRGGLGEDQTLRLAPDHCSNLEFNVFSPLDSDELDFSIAGPCHYFPLSQRSVEIEFLPCTCPDGYMRKDDEKTNCICEGNFLAMNARDIQFCTTSSYYEQR